MTKAKTSKSTQKSRSTTKVVLFVIMAVVLFLLSLLVLTLLLVANNVQKIQSKVTVQSYTFSSTAGPVSPSYQFTKTLTFDVKTCSYVVNFYEPVRAETKPCSIDQASFDTIVASYVNQSIAAAMTANNKRPQTLIGGPEKKMSVQNDNGVDLQTNISQQFKADAQPFFNVVASKIPIFSDLGI